MARYVVVVPTRFLFADGARIAAFALRCLMLMAFGFLGCLCHAYFSS
jgi:hypothetical protein